MTSPLVFTVPGRPVPAGSKRPVLAGGRLRAVDSSGARGRSWRHDVQTAAADALDGRPLIAGPVELHLRFHVARPAGHLGTGRNSGQVRPSAPWYPTTRPDVLKLARAVEDALVGVLIHDDAQIVTELLVKRFAAPGAPTRVEVTVQPLDDEGTS